MSRLPRISPAGIAIHILQRGNNRQSCFVSDENRWTYINLLKEYSTRYGVDIHAWALMTNHVHLLCTPKRDNSVSTMMQAVGRSYVQYFNREHHRSGTLWEGRFKSCLVQGTPYLLELYRYIEMNPVRAGLVNAPGKYRWSSYQINGLGKFSDLCKPRQEYLSLGKDLRKCQGCYRKLCVQPVEDELLKEIRDNSNKGLAIGDDRFKEEIETLTGRRLKSKKRGRPLGWRKGED